MAEFVNFIEGADFNQDKVIIKKVIETPLTKEMQVSIPKDITMKEFRQKVKLSELTIEKMAKEISRVLKTPWIIK